ncbi:hypothetical protein EWM64_g6606 [Hericium alpestre]|uniref:Carboxymuconolactone decarboxylase-like domain-containing protein n=1 Tax=Hericium alpestre TaxID=135208 RepID=A0A4Y9ZTQ6_9AGAM|nr:hypothetical protein EWM64_g6606 [Hericium alpestre]
MLTSRIVLKNPWYIVASVAFATGNRPDAVPRIFKYVLTDLEKAQTQFKVPAEQAHAEKLLLARKMRESLFKSGMVAGYSKVAINGLVSLHEATPEELRDTKPLRDTKIPIEEVEKKGTAFFRSLYGETADGVQNLLDAIHPDMGRCSVYCVVARLNCSLSTGWFSNTIAYGSVYGFTEITDTLETSYTLVGTLIASDTPRQVNWHLANARRCGASLEQGKAVRQIAMEVSESAGVRWRDGVPEVE